LQASGIAARGSPECFRLVGTCGYRRSRSRLAAAGAYSLPGGVGNPDEVIAGSISRPRDLLSDDFVRIP
jgi:hypothetical protein